MKLKGINPIEQHVEKIVLALVAAAFLGVLALQFLHRPNQVEIEPGRKLAPELAFAPVEELARRVGAGVNAVNVDLPEPEPINLAHRFEPGPEELAVAPLRPLGPARLFEGAVVAPTVAGGRFEVAVVTPPAPGVPLASVHRGTLDPYFVARNPEFAPLVPEEQPFDMASVSVQATFQGSELASALLEDPDGEAGPIRPLPAAWWRGNVAIVRVELQRQALGPDGRWGEAESAPLPPGAPDPLGEVLAEAGGVAAMIRAVEDARSFATEIQRPGYYPLIAGDPWATPVEAREAAARAASERTARQAIERYRRSSERLQMLEGELQSLSDEETGRRSRLERQIEAVRRDLERAASELDALGVDPDVGLEFFASHDSVRFEPTTELLSDNGRHLWAHDISPPGGKAYRYRMRVHINNPVFGRGDALVPEQAELAKSPSLAGAWSAWSEPVRVLPRTVFFVASATTGDGISRLPRASVELYRFYYGYWRRGVVGVEPGDNIQASLNLPDPNLMPIYDLSGVTPEGGAPAGTRVRPRGGQQGETGLRRGRGPGDDPGGGTVIRPSGRSGQQGERAPESGVSEGQITLPEGAKPGPESLGESIQEYLIGVAEFALMDPESRSRPAMAYFGDVSGEILTRSPREIEGDPTYQRVKLSAEAGLRQGAREGGEAGLSPAEILRRRQEERREERQQRENRSGGGKGGGGSTGGG